ncbi:hypothetical protein JX265_011969 [Neoarthrinium moseri]|uniref:Uncharacterized protein n=1 Tax=Neoarthrinium moseri TaxID=1658444 RepID=A0A9P9WBI3_9PEZI|nr:hypothetical protein JX265_011969 [Neoarthrinium moseri]
MRRGGLGSLRLASGEPHVVSRGTWDRPVLYLPLHTVSVFCLLVTRHMAMQLFLGLLHSLRYFEVSPHSVSSQGSTLSLAGIIRIGDGLHREFLVGTGVRREGQMLGHNHNRDSSTPSARASAGLGPGPTSRVIAAAMFSSKASTVAACT